MVLRMIAQFSTSFMKGKPTKEETMIKKIMASVALVAFFSIMACAIAAILACYSAEVAGHDAYLAQERENEEMSVAAGHEYGMYIADLAKAAYLQ